MWSTARRCCIGVTMHPFTVTNGHPSLFPEVLGHSLVPCNDASTAIYILESDTLTHHITFFLATLLLQDDDSCLPNRQRQHRCSRERGASRYLLSLRRSHQLKRHLSSLDTYQLSLYDVPSRDYPPNTDHREAVKHVTHNCGRFGRWPPPDSYRPDCPASIIPLSCSLYPTYTLLPRTPDLTHRQALSNLLFLRIALIIPSRRLQAVIT